MMDDLDKDIVNNKALATTGNSCADSRPYRGHILTAAWVKIMSKNEVFKMIVPQALERQRLDKVLTVLLAEKASRLSRARLQALIEKGCVTFHVKAIFDASRKFKNGH